MHLPSMLTVRYFSLCAIAVVISSPTQAFEINGFRSYMKEEEALRILQRRFEHVMPVQQMDTSNTAYLGTSSISSEAESIVLCESRLESYSADVRGGFQAFVRLVERETAIRGPGKYTASSHETSAGSWNTIRFAWRVSEDTKEIFISQVGSQNSQVAVNYVSPSTCNPPKIRKCAFKRFILDIRQQ